MGKYRTIVIDPPWKYGVWGKPNPKSRPNGLTYPMPYKTMTVKEIKGLPISTLAEGDCELYLWTTSKYLKEGFELLDAWGFEYKQIIVWCKRPRGLGQGGVFTPTTEFVLLGRRGKMPKVKRLDSTWYLWKRPHNRHSAKPEEFQDLIERVTEHPRLEMFARRKREGWDVWGNEVESDIDLDVAA